nr:uncharacterized protein si:dkey-92i15.4 [Misgurnus anguillicaudatus]XP_055066719.1 uncharacterized protein si:dkey-92i15.4 [Misgurnus anguillicaudatus]XP_055066720.1 uncharacterized protein si:dkey-92i15.4 [Misgurnus anguillicaudatus]
MSLYPRPTFGRQFSESDGITTDTQLSNETAAQGQSQLSVGSAAARFQIRSANTLHYRPIRHIKEDKSQEGGDKGSEDVKRFYDSNKSKSLDWRGAGARRGHGNATWTSGGTRDSGNNFVRRAESLGKKENNNNVTSDTEANLPNSISWRSHDYNVTEQRDRKVYPNSVSTPMGTNRIIHNMEQTGSGQSLPARMKPRLSQGSIGEASSLWAQLPHDETSLDQTDNKVGVWARDQGRSNTQEVTGNQTILERIEKLLGSNFLHSKSDANSNDLVIDKRNPTLDSGHLNSDTMNSHFRQRKSNPTSPSGPLSPTDNQQWRPSYTVEKSGTFPRWFSKSEQTPYSKIQEPSTPETINEQKGDSSGVFFSKPKWGMEKSSDKTIQSLLSKSEQTPYNKMQEPSTPEIRNDQKDYSSGVFFSKPKRDIEKSPGKSIQSFPPAASEELTKMNSLELKSQSIERTRSKVFETAQPSGQRTTAQMILQSTSSDGISNQSVKQLATPSAGIKKEIEKDEPTQPKHPLASRGAPHGEIHQEDSSAVKTEEKRGDEETISSPTLDSVKNTIHKFEALAQQSQNAPQIIRARRALSVPEQPKPVVHVRKSDSDINLNFRKMMGNTERIKTNSIEEPEGNLDRNRTHHSNLTINVQPTSKQRMTYKTRIELIPTFSQLHEPKSDQHISTWDKRWTVRNRHIDEPDLTITPGTGLQRSNTDSQLSKVNRLLKQQSIHVNMDDNNDEFDDDTPTNSPDRDPLTVNMQRQNSTLKPQTAARTLERSDGGASISVKSADNVTYPKVVNPSQSSASTVPAPPIYSSFNTSNNNNYKRALEDVGPTVTSMARWSSDEEDYDDDDDDYGGTDSEDSDSGESSVTITSNMSQSDRRSFSLSLQELCIFGGVDYKPSDDEDWAPSRSASLCSDISAFSSVTLLSNNELDRLMDDVKNLGDETLQKYEDVQVVVLHKEVGSGLGFTLAGGVDQNKPVTVHRVIPGGVAAQEGSIFEGAWVLSINGTPLQKSAHWEALRTLRRARSQTMAVVVLQNVYQNETIHTPVNTGRRVHVTLNKASYDLGFSLEGGLDSSLGDKPLTVQKIFQGGPVSQVFPGDELLEVQGQSLIGMRRIEAVNLIRRLPPGPVEVLLHRPHQPH